jgi:asparagine synthase (glutamine-hydrolysing)
VFQSITSLFGRRPQHEKSGAGIASAVRDASLTYLTHGALCDLYELAVDLERASTPGVFVEAGCALGGSAIVLAAAKRPERRLQVYDVFGMIPPPSERDGDDVRARYQAIRDGESAGIGGNTYYGYEKDLIGTVRANFARFSLPVARNNVSLVKGLFQDTMHFAEPVALAHVDGDWYESVMTCLTRIDPVLVPGGVMVIDDYDAWSGCRTAVDEFLATRGRYELRRRARVQLVRR